MAAATPKGIVGQRTQQRIELSEKPLISNSEAKYRSLQFEFIVVLPQKDHSPLETLRKLSETGLEPLRQAMSRAEVEISLPKVSMRNRFELEDILKRKGVLRLFDKELSEIALLDERCLLPIIRMWLSFMTM